MILASAVWNGQSIVFHRRLRSLWYKWIRAHNVASSARRRSSMPWALALPGTTARDKVEKDLIAADVVSTTVLDLDMVGSPRGRQRTAVQAGQAGESTAKRGWVAASVQQPPGRIVARTRRLPLEHADAHELMLICIVFIPLKR